MEQQVLSRYDIVREIGRGGIGIVYQARDTRLDRTVAIKVLHDGDEREDRRLRGRPRAAARCETLDWLDPHLGPVGTR